MVERIQRINRIRPVDSYSSGQSGLKQKRKKQAPSFKPALNKLVFLFSHITVYLKLH